MAVALVVVAFILVVVEVVESGGICYNANPSNATKTNATTTKIVIAKQKASHFSRQDA